ncbi:hypothetical protein HPULCUR_004784 [Helicostylum pulchrum]|uniref:Uncharacterized protein n=1 Tax=Helicostylum pulchrum TaxID=562976 RepID=A0ABP9XYH8_9FUNG
MKPECNDKNIEKFKVTTKDCRTNKIDRIITQIPLSQWSDVEKLVDFICPQNSKKFLNRKTCYERYVTSFTIVLETLVRHPNVQKQAIKMLKYLRTPTVKRQFEEYYEEVVRKAKLNDNITTLQDQERTISQLHVELENQEIINELESRINSGEPSTSAPLPSAPERAQPAKVSLENTKDNILNCAVEIHDL